MRVACCTLARKLLEDCKIFIGSHVLSIGPVFVKDRKKIDRLIIRYAENVCLVSKKADDSDVRMLDRSAEAKAITAIKKSKKSGDTLGGVFEVIVSGVPIGLGSYVHYDRKLDGMLAQALMSIQAIKGVEIGEGFANAAKFGSDVHDEFMQKNRKIIRRTNRAGGMEGSMTNGEMIVLHAAMKPIATLVKPLRAIDLKTKKMVQSHYERSDVCAVPAASVIGEAVIAPVLANALLEKFGGDSMKELLSRCNI
jgi:chorismate synthase